jgi:hypothetical protein
VGGGREAEGRSVLRGGRKGREGDGASVLPVLRMRFELVGHGGGGEVGRLRCVGVVVWSLHAGRKYSFILGLGLLCLVR